MTAPRPSILFDAKDENGKTVPAAAEAGKLGNVFIVNRLTGKLLHKSDAFVKQADNMFVVPSDKPFSRYPGINGGNLWSPAAYLTTDPEFLCHGHQSGLHCDRLSLSRTYVPGTPTVGQQVGGSQKPSATDQFPAGPAPSQRSMSTPARSPGRTRPICQCMAAILATASNLIFTGEMTGGFDAFDAMTGEKLWSQNLGIGVCTPPITYRVKGAQYVAVGAAGCNHSAGLLKDQSKSRFSDTIVLYTLTPG